MYCRNNIFSIFNIENKIKSLTKKNFWKPCCPEPNQFHYLNSDYFLKYFLFLSHFSRPLKFLVFDFHYMFFLKICQSPWERHNVFWKLFLCYAPLSNLRPTWMKTFIWRQEGVKGNCNACPVDLIQETPVRKSQMAHKNCGSKLLVFLVTTAKHFQLFN